MLFLAAFILPHCAAFCAAGGNQHTKPGDVKLFQDWVVGCDNSLACQAVALMPEARVDAGLSLQITRTMLSPVDTKIQIAGFSSASEQYRLMVDGRVIHTGVIDPKSQEIMLSGADAVRVIRNLARGKNMTVVDGAGTYLGAISLSGSAAAMRSLDAQQGRAGTRLGLIKNGRKKPSKKAIALPIIKASRITPTDQIPDAAALVALAEGSACANERRGVTEDSAYSLGRMDGADIAIALISCGSRAYNASSATFIGTRDSTGKWIFDPARFDYDVDFIAKDAKLSLLVNAGWDGSSQSLTIYKKDSNIGDCGQRAEYIWDGNMFRLTRAIAMPQCRGVRGWIPIWRAQVELAG